MGNHSYHNESMFKSKDNRALNPREFLNTSILDDRFKLTMQEPIGFEQMFTSKYLGASQGADQLPLSSSSRGQTTDPDHFNQTTDLQQHSLRQNESLPISIVENPSARKDSYSVKSSSRQVSLE